MAYGEWEWDVEASEIDSDGFYTLDFKGKSGKSLSVRVDNSVWPNVMSDLDFFTETLFDADKYDERYGYYATLLSDHLHVTGAEFKIWDRLFSEAGLVRFDRESFPYFSFDNAPDGRIQDFFYACELKKVDLSEFYSSNVKMIANMFSCCDLLEVIDFSNWDFTGICLDDPLAFKENILLYFRKIIFKNIKGNISPFIENIKQIVEERKYYSSVEDIEEFHGLDVFNGFGEEFSLEKALQTIEIIVSPEKYYEVSEMVKGYEDSIQVKVDWDFSAITAEIQRMTNCGKSDKDILSALQGSGASSGDIVMAMVVSGRNSDVFSAYSEKVLKPSISNALSVSNSSGKSRMTVSEIANTLYKKYPRMLVDMAIVDYLGDVYVEV